MSKHSLISYEFLFGNITTGDTHSLVSLTVSIIPASNQCSNSLSGKLSFYHEDKTEYDNASEQMELQIHPLLIPLIYIFCYTDKIKNTIICV